MQKKNSFFNITTIFCILNLIVVSAFWYRFSSPISSSTASFFTNDDHIGSFLSAQANHYALLQVYLVIFSILVGLGAFWGYNEIKKEASKKAEAKVKEIVPNLIRKHLENFGPDALAQLLFKEKMEAPSLKNSNDVFNDNIETILGGPDV